MANAPKTPGGKSPVKRTGRPAAKKPAPPVRKAAADPALLTATEAFDAVATATGEKLDPIENSAPFVTVPEPEAPVAAVQPEEPKVEPAPVAASTPEPDTKTEVVEVKPDLPVEPIVTRKTIETTKTVPAPEPLVAQPSEGKTAMTDIMETSKKFAEEAKTKFESAFADINEKAKAGVEKSSKAIEELSEITKGNVEALVESGKIAAKGVEAMGQDAAEYSRKSFEKATATMKSFAAVKSPTEFFQLQSELMSSAFDAFAKETAKSSEAMLKLAGDVAQPISNRVSIVTEKVKALAA